MAARRWVDGCLTLLGLLFLAASCQRTASQAVQGAATGSAPLEARASPDLTGPPHQIFPTAALALAQVLKSRPRVLGLGEFHQKKSTVRVVSAIKRFRDQLLDTLAREASDLIVETWLTEGKCGETEKRVVRDVEKTTKRPESTEDEVLAVLQRAKALGVRPHILRVSCSDYKLLLGAGEVDYEKLLGMITRHLRDKASSVLSARERAPITNAKRDGTGASRRTVVIYGGALHNDLYPHEGLEAFSYAEALQKKSGGRYVELDLYVPEYVEGDEALRQEPWYPLLRLASTKGVVLVERGQGSYILILQRSPIVR
jgi:hypothetical protein